MMASNKKKAASRVLSPPPFPLPPTKSPLLHLPLSCQTYRSLPIPNPSSLSSRP
ncbi:hypothetical protein M6B38_311600 [Iris pallida]|uniref:Uncharacterized protein n=1 Tax=Iris pallida TaxID=29817 RepID=A0AAX6HGT5_IRIPA|nr:hypothetical protein M6B38_311600 [Iris pallida]